MGMRLVDVSLLAFLRSAANKNYEPVAILAEVNPVTRTKIDPVLKQAGPGALSARKIALLNARQSNRNFGRRLGVQPVGPRCKRATSAAVKVLAYFDHNQW